MRLILHDIAGSTNTLLELGDYIPNLNGVRD